MITKEEALDKLSQSHTGRCVMNFPDYLRDDEDIILKAMEHSSLNIRYASERIRNDPGIMSQAIGDSHYNFKHCGAELFSDKDFILSHISYSSTISKCYKLCSRELQYDRDFAKQFIKINPPVYEYIPLKFKKDKEFAWIAMESGNFSQVIKYHQDENIVEKGLENIHNYLYLPEKMRDDKKWVYKILYNKDNGDEVNEHLLKFMGDTLKNDKGLFKELINYNFYLFAAASDDLKDDVELLELLLEKKDIKHSHTYTNAVELLEPLITQDILLLNYASEATKNNRHLILKALRYDLDNIAYASSEIQNMLGKKENEYIERLEIIIQKEKFVDHLSVCLEDKAHTKKHKI